MSVSVSPSVFGVSTHVPLFLLSYFSSYNCCCFIGNILFVIVALFEKVFPVFHCVYIRISLCCTVHIMLSFATTEHYWTVGKTVRLVHVYV